MADDDWRCRIDNDSYISWIIYNANWIKCGLLPTYLPCLVDFVQEMQNCFTQTALRSDGILETFHQWFATHAVDKLVKIPSDWYLPFWATFCELLACVSVGYEDVLYCSRSHCVACYCLAATILILFDKSKKEGVWWGFGKLITLTLVDILDVCNLLTVKAIDYYKLNFAKSI